MDINKEKFKKIFKYALGVGAGLGLGYYAYKKFFKSSKINEEIDSLDLGEAIRRSEILKDIKYNIFFKLLYQEKNAFTQINHALVKSSIKGYLELEFNLLKIEDITLEFSGILLNIKKPNSDEKVNYSFDNINHKILIRKESLNIGHNKFSFLFTNNHCDKGIIYNDHTYYTNFQPFGAHHCFPCFDQPDLKTEISLVLVIPKKMKAFGSTRSKDLDDKSDDLTKRYQLNGILDVNNPDDFKYVHFERTRKLSLYSFFFCCGDLISHEFKHPEEKLQQRIITLENKHDISEELKNTIFSFTEVFLMHFKKFINVDYFPCEFINHIFLPYYSDIKEKSMDNYSNIIYPDSEIDKIKDRNEFLFFLTLIGKSLINQFFGHNINLKWWDDFWFKESISIYLAYEFNSHISQYLVEDMKSKNEIISCFSEIEELKDTWSLFVKYNTKAYIFDKLKGKNHPIRIEFENTEQIFRMKDEMTYCKGPAIFRYLSYCLGQNVFFDMLRLFITKYKDNSATFRDFLDLIPPNIDEERKKYLNKIITNIDEYYLKNRCPPTFQCEIESDEKSNRIKSFKINRTQIEGRNFNLGYVLTDVRLFYTNKDAKDSSFYKYENHHKVELFDHDENYKRFENLEKPDFVLLNYTDSSYMIQIFTPGQIEWVKNNIAALRDPITKAVIVRNLVIMAYNNLFSVRELIEFLMELLNSDNNLFNYEFFIKTTIFFIREFVTRDLHRGEYKRRLFNIIALSLGNISLGSLKNSFIKSLIDLTDPKDEEEILKLIEFLQKDQDRNSPNMPFGRGNSGNFEISEGIFKKLESLLFTKFHESINIENLRRLEVLLLECDFFSKEEKDHITEAFTKKIFKILPQSRERIVNTIKNPEEAWKNIVELSLKKSFCNSTNFIMEGFFRSNLQDERRKYVTPENILILFNNSLTNNNNHYIIALLRYSKACLLNNDETKSMYERCLRLYQTHKFDKVIKQDPKIIELLLHLIYGVYKRIDNAAKYEIICGQDSHLEDSLDNSKTYGN